jgi:pimeloyl-ACP methyl ester carboxylesterase
MIPGAHMKPGDLVAAGFLADVASRGLALEVRVLDCDPIGTTLQGAAPAPAAAELLRARREGRRRVWLGGISLGGLLALFQAIDEPDSLDGLCLIAPYPGSRLTQAAIAQAGGLDVWRATAEQLEDAEFRVWRWLQRPPEGLRTFIGWGRQDRFAPAIGQLAGCFPPRARCIVDGGHDWATWRRLWDRFLDAGHFAA